MAHDASQNNPKKEIACALIGIVALLVMILGIAVSGWLRPAGNHEVATVSATEAGQKLEEVLKTIEKPKAEEAPATEATADSASTDTATAETDSAKADSAEATAEPAESAEGTAEATAEGTTDTAKEEPAPAPEGETAKTE